MARYRFSETMMNSVYCMLAALLLLAGCAQAPNWANPLRLWDTAARGEKLADGGDSEPPGLDDPYPKLTDMPARPQPVLTPEEQQRLLQQLQEDLRKARETDKDLRDRTS